MSHRATQCFCLPFLPKEVALNSDAFGIHKDEVYSKEQWLAIIEQLIRDYESRRLVGGEAMASDVMPESALEDV